MSAKSQTVLAGPEFGIVHVMRPFVGFEAVYQGQAANLPIYLCEANRPYDPLALKGVPGFDSHLVSALPCEIGCRVLIWVPDVDTLGVDSHPYPLHVGWRFNNLYKTRNSTDRVPWHIPKQGEGTPDTGPVDPGARVVIPAAYDSVIYQQSEPVAPLFVADSYVHPNKVSVRSAPMPPPLMPDGVRGAVQQGITAFDASGYYLSPQSVLYELQAAGDEMLLFYRRPDHEMTNPWDFTVRDRIFSNFFGNGTGVEYPDKGVYVSFGISP